MVPISTLMPAFVLLVLLMIAAEPVHAAAQQSALAGSVHAFKRPMAAGLSTELFGEFLTLRDELQALISHHRPSTAPAADGVKWWNMWWSWWNWRNKEKEEEEEVKDDMCVMQLGAYALHLHGILENYFADKNDTNWKDVENAFAWGKETLDKLGLYTLIGQQKPFERNFHLRNEFSTEEKQAIEAMMERMARGELTVKTGKLTLLEPTATEADSVHDAREVECREIVMKVGQTFRFYFAKDQLKLLAKQVELVKEQLRKKEKPSSDVETLQKLKSLLLAAYFLFSNLKKDQGDYANPKMNKTDYIDGHFKQIAKRLQMLKPNDQTQELKIDVEFALAMAQGKCLTAEQKRAFDILLGGSNHSTELFQVVGTVLLQYFHYHYDYVSEEEKEEVEKVEEEEEHLLMRPAKRRKYKEPAYDENRVDS